MAKTKQADPQAEEKKLRKRLKKAEEAHQKAQERVQEAQVALGKALTRLQRREAAVAEARTALEEQVAPVSEREGSTLPLGQDEPVEGAPGITPASEEVSPAAEIEVVGEIGIAATGEEAAAEAEPETTPPSPVGRRSRRGAGPGSDQAGGQQAEGGKDEQAAVERAEALGLIVP